MHPDPTRDSQRGGMRQRHGHARANDVAGDAKHMNNERIANPNCVV
jgi:hypothetical protein